MKPNKRNKAKRHNLISRRDFLRTSAAFSGAALLAGGSGFAYAAGSDRIKVGLIGCGGRGTGAARDCVSAAKGVEIYALGDLFPDQVEWSFNDLKDGHDWGRDKVAGLGEKLTATKSRCFSGFDAYMKVIKSGVDMVILATPPNFRPEHLAAAVKAGKHVFMEKPVAVDPPGVRSVIQSSELAEKKRVAIVAGTQRRHQPSYNEIIRRIHDGALGELVGGQCYWNGGELWYKDPGPEWTQVETQIRNWLYFTWLSGDHIVEQHVHNLDIMNWAFGGPPVKCMGMGGRQTRTDPKYGNIFDHFAVEYEYANGARILSMCRQEKGATNRVSERLVGTKGTANPSWSIWGENKYEFDGEYVSGYVEEHADLIASIRKNKPLNEGKRIAESTLTAIIGRMSAYTGRELKYEWALNSSKLDLSPPKLEFGDMPAEPVAVPGETKLI